MHGLLLLVILFDVFVISVGQLHHLFVLQEKAFLLCFIDLDGRHKHSLCEQRIDLLHKLYSRIVLIDDQAINVLDDDGQASSLEEHDQLFPISSLVLETLMVLEGVHVDVSWEVPAEDLSNQEPIVESTFRVLH